MIAKHNNLLLPSFLVEPLNFSNVACKLKLCAIHKSCFGKHHMLIDGQHRSYSMSSMIDFLSVVAQIMVSLSMELD